MNSVFTIPELVYTILALPVAFSILAAVNVCGNTVLHWLNRLTATAAAAVAVQLVLAFDPALPAAFGYFYLDALGLWMLLIITALYLAFAWTSKAIWTAIRISVMVICGGSASWKDAFMRCRISSSGR